MPYKGAKLAPWFDAAPNRRALRRIADAGGEAMVRNVRRRTPVDTGVLHSSIRKKAVVFVVTPLGHLAAKSGAETDVEYAPYVEHGTGLWGPRRARYLITPRDPDGMLHWVDAQGRDVFARRVWHPGSPGAHMFLRGAAETEAEYQAIARPALLRWAVEVERQNTTGLGRP